MTRYVALLRGVNVARHSLPMAELRAVVEGLGYAEVGTYIQSGNVLFDAKGDVDVTAIEAAIQQRFSMEVLVTLRSAGKLRRIVDANPFPDADPSKLHVGFLARTLRRAEITGLDTERLAPEQCVLGATEIYLHLPNGMGRAKLPVHLGRRLSVPATYRNWNTVTTLAELAGPGGATTGGGNGSPSRR